MVTILDIMYGSVIKDVTILDIMYGSVIKNVTILDIKYGSAIKEGDNSRYNVWVCDQGY